jgi:hypothetical protein
MRQAIERAQMGEFDGARVFLDIARELRLGSAPSPALQRTKHLGDHYLLPICEPDAGANPEGSLVTFSLPGVTCRDCLRLATRRQICYCDVEPGGHISGTITSCSSVRPVGETAGTRVERLDIPQDDTPSIPVGVAHPEPGSVGETSTCLNCTYPVRWMRGPGWVHDRDHYPAPCAPAFT